MSLRHTHKKLVEPNSEEDLDKVLFDLTKDDLKELCVDAWKKETYGKEACAQIKWRAMRYYQYLAAFTKLIQKDYYRRLQAGEECPAEGIYTKYKIDCVRANLRCISKTLGKNYNTALTSFFQAAGLPLTATCSDCPGIGTMIMEGESFPTAYDINLC